MQSAAIYLRRSVDDPKGYSIPEQREQCTRYAEQHGYRVVAEYVDDGDTGATLQRPGIMRLFRDLERNEIDAVIVLDPDRLARDLHLQIIADKAIQQHASLLFVAFKRENNEEGNLFFHLRGAIAQYERAKIRTRTMAGRRQKAKAGRLPFKVEPYGYTYNPNTSMAEINPDEAPVIELIFNLFVLERESISGIVRELNQRGIPSRTGKQWRRQVVRQILENTVYRGVYYANRNNMSDVFMNRYKAPGEKFWGSERPREEWIPVKVPAIISPEIWFQAQELLAASRRTSQANRSTYLLSGLVNCLICGLSMSGVRRNNWGKKVRYYTCRRGYVDARHPGCTPPRFIKADEIEALVWEQVTGWMEHPELLLEHLQQESQQDLGTVQRLQEFDREIQKIRSARQDLLDLVVKRLVSKADVEERLNQLNSRERYLLGEIDRLRRANLVNVFDPKAAQDMIAEVRNILANLDELPLAEKRKILRQFVVGVDVNENEINIRATLPPVARKNEH